MSPGAWLLTQQPPCAAKPYVPCRLEELGLLSQAEAAVLRFARDDTVSVKVRILAPSGRLPDAWALTCSWSWWSAVVCATE